MREIRIFVSSPNELFKEREMCKKTIDEMNEMLGSYFNVHLKPYLWESDVKTAGMGPALTRTDNPAKYDIYIGMLWREFGTPTGMLDGKGKEYVSGTYQEFVQAYESYVKTGKPEILFLQKTQESAETSADPQVARFFSEFSTGCTHEGIYGHFTTESDLAFWVQKWLFDYVSKNDKNVDLHGHYAKAGIVSLYLKEDNDKRNSRKKESLSKASHVKLLARAGNSYLNDEAQRFYGPLYDCLERGGTAEIILANPYSEMGYYLTLGDVSTKVCDETISERWNKSAARKEADALKAIADIENSKWVTTLKTAINGYLELKEKFGDRIVLRMSKYEINCTLLITETNAFFEPYIHCTGSTRGMNAFEVEMDNKDDLKDVYGSISQYFSFMWDLSEDYAEYVLNIDNYKNLLQQSLLSGLFKQLK